MMTIERNYFLQRRQPQGPQQRQMQDRQRFRSSSHEDFPPSSSGMMDRRSNNENYSPIDMPGGDRRMQMQKMSMQMQNQGLLSNNDRDGYQRRILSPGDGSINDGRKNAHDNFHPGFNFSRTRDGNDTRGSMRQGDNMRSSMRNSIRNSIRESMVDSNDMRDFSNMRDGMEGMTNWMNSMRSRDEMRDFNDMGPRGMAHRQDQMMKNMNVMMMQGMDNMNMGMGMNTKAMAMSPGGRMGVPPVSPGGRMARMPINDGMFSNPMDQDVGMNRAMRGSFKRMRGLSDMDMMTPIERDGVRESLGRNHSMMADTSDGSKEGKFNFADGTSDTIRRVGMESGNRRFTNPDLNNFVSSPKSNASMSDFMTFPSPSPFGMSRPTFSQFMASRQRSSGMTNPMNEVMFGIRGDSMMDKDVKNSISRGNNSEPFTPNGSMHLPFSPGMRRAERMSLSPGKMTGMEQFMANSSMGVKGSMSRVGGMDRMDGTSNMGGLEPREKGFAYVKGMMAQDINDHVSNKMNMPPGKSLCGKEQPGKNCENDISMMPPPPFSSEGDISTVPAPSSKNPGRQPQPLLEDKDPYARSNKRNRTQMEEPHIDNTYDGDEPPPPSLLHAKIRRKNSSGANGTQQKGATSKASNPVSQQPFSPRSPTPKKGLLERQRIMEDEMKTHMAEAYGVLQKRFGNVYPLAKNGQDGRRSSPHEGVVASDTNPGDASLSPAIPTFKSSEHTEAKAKDEHEDDRPLKELKSPATKQRPSVALGKSMSQNENNATLTKTDSTGSTPKSSKAEDIASNSSTTIKTKKSSTKYCRKDSGVKSGKKKKDNIGNHADDAESSSAPNVELLVDIQKPRRPFSAYNLYFQLEREWITQNIAMGKTTADLNREDGIVEIENGELRAIPKTTCEKKGAAMEDKKISDQTPNDDESRADILSKQQDAAVKGDVVSSPRTEESKMQITSDEVKESANVVVQDASEEDSKEAEAILLSLNPTNKTPEVGKKPDSTDPSTQNEPITKSQNDPPKENSEKETDHDPNDDNISEKPSSNEKQEKSNKSESNIENDQFCDSEMPERYRKLKLEKNWFRAGYKSKRKHRKTEGSVGFIEMTRMISARWSVVDEEIRKYCQKLADGELRDYRLETQKYKTLIDQAQREAKLAAKFKSDLEKERKKSTSKSTGKKTKKEKDRKPPGTANGSGEEPTPVTDQSKKSLLDSVDHAMSSDRSMFIQNHNSAPLARSDPHDGLPQAKRSGGLPGLPPPPFSEARQSHDFGRKYNNNFIDSETRHQIMQQRMRELQGVGTSFGRTGDMFMFDGHRDYGSRFGDGNMHPTAMGRMERFMDGRDMPPLEREELLAMRNMMLSNRMTYRDNGNMMTGGSSFPNRMLGTFDSAPNMQNRSEQEFDVEVDRFLNCLGKEVSDTNRGGSAGDGDGRQLAGMGNGPMSMRNMGRLEIDENMGMHSGPMISRAEMNRRSFRQDAFSRNRDDEPALPEYEWGNR